MTWRKLTNYCGYCLLLFGVCVPAAAFEGAVPRATTAVTTALPSESVIAPVQKRDKKKKLPFPSAATLRPKRKMEAVAVEIGVEIGSRAFLAKSAYGGDLAKAQASAKSTITNLDRRYLHATGIKHTLGKVIIRTDPANDPLRDLVKATGGGAEARSSLEAFQTYWNEHPDVVGKTHDLACYHTYYAPSGLAYTSSVGGIRRYATVGGRGATSWANGTLCHEFGHSWGLKHVGDSGLFYESGPRDKRGSHTPGGESRPMSIMVGSSNNIGRMASDEAETVMATLQQKRRFAEPWQPGPVKPYAKRDEVVVAKSAVVIDVVDNDYDVNNDVLDVALLDTVSRNGGRITLSRKTGPGKRNEIKYTPPVGRSSEVDFFHYTVFDTDGLTDFGAVYIRSHFFAVDLEATEYHYDFGPVGSPIQGEFALVTPQTQGDIFWKGKKVEAADRGSAKGVNAINQDFISSTSPAVLRHRIADGTWQVTLNMGDRTGKHDRMAVWAEGKVVNKAIDSDRGKFSYVNDRKQNEPTNHFTVVVKDGFLDLKFSDAGGADKTWVVNRLSIKKVDP